jgi:hypothetical protein
MACLERGKTTLAAALVALVSGFRRTVNRELIIVLADR